MRIVSFLPSATEILYAIGLGDQVVGITHECDYPPDVRTKPVLTRCAFDSERMTQKEIDDEVRRLAREEKSLYEIHDEKLRQANPDLIVTQDLCHVCAITPREVDRAIGILPGKPKVVSLNPKLLEDVFSDMHLLSDITDAQSGKLIEQLQGRVRDVLKQTLPLPKVTVGCIEWFDPIWRTGHWVPEMVQLAGGVEMFAEIGKSSRTLPWDELQEKNPDILIFMPCGSSLEKTKQQFQRAADKYEWKKLKAFQNHRAYFVDANSYFSRSGPRLVEGLELLAEILHPDYFTNMAPVDSYLRID